MHKNQKSSKRINDIIAKTKRILFVGNNNVNLLRFDVLFEEKYVFSTIKNYV